MCEIPHQISAQLRDYAMACDLHQWDRLAALFERGKFHFADQPGPEGVLRWGREVCRPDARTQHIISTVHVDVDDSGSHASGTCYLTLISHTEDIQVVSACYFDNEWELQDGRWWWTKHRIVPLFRGDTSRIHQVHQVLEPAHDEVTDAPAS